MNLGTFPLLDRLRGAKSILIAGAGGGFDIFCGLPLYLALTAAGAKVHLANLSFTYLGGTDAPRLTPELCRITADTDGPAPYFPEKHLAAWLASRGDPAPVYAFEKVGVVPLRAAYARLVRELSLDAIVLVDGGTDILMRGNEAGLGTPEEDSTSLAAVAGIQLPHRYVVCLGFGIDAFHGVPHSDCLEAMAELLRDGGSLGATALLPGMPEVAGYLEAIEYVHARMPEGTSIVNDQIASAIEGVFGNVHRNARTRGSGSTLFVNPLMTIYWAFELDRIAKRSLYLPRLEGTQSIFEVAAIIEAFRNEVSIRSRTAIPL